MQEPGKVVETIEKSGKLPEGDDERFTGYGLMGVPFRSGHVLCLRRFPVTSIGRGYTSVWHRDPGGCWTLIQDVPPQNGCSRYFGSAVDRSLVQDILLSRSLMLGRCGFQKPSIFTLCLSAAKIHTSIY